MLLIINSDPISEKHISWFTNCYSSTHVELREVVERTYQHPEAPEYATVKMIEIKCHSSFNRLGVDAGVVVLLEASLNSVSHQLRKGE